jgi:hypothetical protein
MKSYNHLFEKLVDFDNIYSAILSASKGKKKRKDVAKVLKHAVRYVYRLQEILNGKKLKIRKHKAVLINDGIHLKKRLIIKPDFVWEQILHHAIVQVLAPIFIKSMYKWSCGSLPKRGGLYGKRYLAKYIRENPSKIKYVLKADVEHFFPSVNVEVLKKLLRKKIHDERFLEVLFVVLDSNIAIYNNEEMNMGLPIGYYLSQWLANWLLTDMDYKIKQKHNVKCYVRYVDDFVLLHHNKKELRKIRGYIQDHLKDICLKMKRNYQVFRFHFGDEKGRVIDFMGFKFYRNRTVLRKTIMLKAVKKARKLKAVLKKNWFECTQILSYFGWFKHANMYNVYSIWIKPCINLGECKKIVSLHSYKERRLTNVINLEKSRELRKAS